MGHFPAHPMQPGAEHFRPPVQTEMLDVGCHNGKKRGQLSPGKVKLDKELP